MSTEVEQYIDKWIREKQEEYSYRILDIIDYDFDDLEFNLRRMVATIDISAVEYIAKKLNTPVVDILVDFGSVDINKYVREILSDKCDAFFRDRYRNITNRYYILSTSLKDDFDLISKLEPKYQRLFIEFMFNNNFYSLPCFDLAFLKQFEKVMTLDEISQWANNSLHQYITDASRLDYCEDDVEDYDTLYLNTYRNYLNIPNELEECLIYEDIFEMSQTGKQQYLVHFPLSEQIKEQIAKNMNYYLIEDLTNVITSYL